MYMLAIESYEPIYIEMDFPLIISFWFLLNLFQVDNTISMKRESSFFGTFLFCSCIKV